jgi:hypothetical protein
MKIKRDCLVCGDEIIVCLNKDGTYSNGNYFGKLESRNNLEYWECDKCFKED